MAKRYLSGGTHAGMGAWLLQRLTSVYIAIFALFLLVHFSFAPVIDYVSWKRWWSDGVIQSASFVFVACILLHIWVGLRSVWMDYLRPVWLRFLVTTATAVGLIFLALWSAQILW